MSLILLNERYHSASRAAVRLLLTIAASVAVVLVLATPASARPAHGNYACYYYYSTGGSPFFMGYLHIDSASKYHYTGAGHGSGTYTSSGKRLTFHGGPLKHEYGITEGWKGSGSSRYYRLDLYISKNKSYASTCDGPHAK